VATEANCAPYVALLGMCVAACAGRSRIMECSLGSVQFVMLNAIASSIYKQRLQSHFHQSPTCSNRTSVTASICNHGPRTEFQMRSRGSPRSEGRRRCEMAEVQRSNHRLRGQSAKRAHRLMCSNTWLNRPRLIWFPGLRCQTRRAHRMISLMKSAG
jgi:hypothetical protein